MLRRSIQQSHGRDQDATTAARRTGQAEQPCYEQVALQYPLSFRANHSEIRGHSWFAEGTQLGANVSIRYEQCATGHVREGRQTWVDKERGGWQSQSRPVFSGEASAV